MPKASDEIFFISDEQFEALPSRPMRQGLFGVTLEDAFQKLLEKYPEVIPGRQISPGAEEPPRFLLIRREAPLSGWSLDHLMVDQHGILTLVECKLLENPESRREVVGQIIEYAANAKIAWGGGQLRDFAHNYWSGQGKAFDDAFHSTLDPDEEIDEFWSRVEDNLDQGNIRLIIAGDEIRPEVRRMIEYLNEEMEHVEVLGLELKCYGAEDEKIVLVPTIIGQSQASVDRRRTAARTKKWTPDALEEAFQAMDDQELAARYLRILEWARDNDCFIASTAMRPTFGIANAKRNRIFGIYQSEGLWPFFETTKFADQEERDRFANELKAGGFLESDLDPDAKSTVKIPLPDQAAMEHLLSILAGHIG